jgi:hypothetical protein
MDVDVDDGVQIGRVLIVLAGYRQHIAKMKKLKKTSEWTIFYLRFWLDIIVDVYQENNSETLRVYFSNEIWKFFSSCVESFRKGTIDADQMHSFFQEMLLWIEENTLLTANPVPIPKSKEERFVKDFKHYDGLLDSSDDNKEYDLQSLELEWDLFFNTFYFQGGDFDFNFLLTKLLQICSNYERTVDSSKPLTQVHFTRQVVSLVSFYHTVIEPNFEDVKVKKPRIDLDLDL